MSVLKIVILSSPLNILYIRRIFTTDENLRKKKGKTHKPVKLHQKLLINKYRKKKKKNPAYNNNPNSQKINNSNARRGTNLADIFTRIFFSPNTNAFQFQRDLKKFEEGEKKKKHRSTSSFFIQPLRVTRRLRKNPVTRIILDF